MGLEHRKTGTQWDWNTGTYSDWITIDWDTVGLEDNETGTQWDWNTVRLGHNGTRSQRPSPPHTAASVFLVSFIQLPPTAY